MVRVYTAFLLSTNRWELQVIAPMGYAFSPADQGGPGDIDSDVDPSTGYTAMIPLGAGQTATDEDAGLVAYGSGGGYEFAPTEAAMSGPSDFTPGFGSGPSLGSGSGPSSGSGPTIGSGSGPPIGSGSGPVSPPVAPYHIGVADRDVVTIANDNSTVVYSDTQLTPGAPISSTAGQFLNNALVATFTDADSTRTAADYTAAIDWGDGSTAPAQVDLVSPGHFEVRGSYAYENAGVLPVTVTVTANYYRDPNFPDPAEIVYHRDVVTHLTAVVDPAIPAPTLTAQDLSTTVDEALPGTGGWTVIATFAGDPFTDDRYTAQVFDGTGDKPVNALVQADPFGGDLQVLIPSDTFYQLPGIYTARVVVRDTTDTTEPGGAIVATADATVTVTNPNGPALTDLNVVPVQTTVQTDRTGITLASFALDRPLGDFQVQIDWGDVSAPQDAVLSTDGTSVFVAAPAGGYADPGSYGVTITISDTTTGVTLATIGTTALVADQPLAADPTAPAAIERAPGSAGAGDYFIAALVSTNTQAPATDYQVQISWGDGAVSAGTVYGSDGRFWVGGDHPYQFSGAYTAVVKVWNVNSPWQVWETRTAVTVADLPEGSGEQQQVLGVARVVSSDGFDDVRGWMAWNGNGGLLALADVTKVSGSEGVGSGIGSGPGAGTGSGSGAGMPPPLGMGMGSGRGTGSGGDGVATDYYTVSTFGSATPGYTQPVTYDPSVEVVKGNAAGSTTWPVRAADDPLSAQPESPPDVTQAGTEVLAFTDPAALLPGAPDPATAHEAILDYGDGFRAPGSVQVDSANPTLFHVFTTVAHAYATTALVQFSVLVTDTTVASGGGTGGGVSPPGGSGTGGAGTPTTVSGAATLLSAFAVSTAVAGTEFRAYQRRDEVDNATWVAAGPSGEVSVNTGAVELSHQLDFDQSPGTSVGGDPHLVYNSSTLNPKPEIEAVVPLANIPRQAGYQLHAVLTGLGDQPIVSNFDLLTDPTAFQQVIAQRPTQALAEGVYKWTLTVTVVDVDGNQVAETPTWTKTDLAQVVNNTQSQFGAGWALDLQWRLKVIDQPDQGLSGVQLIYGTGESRFFQQKANGKFENPPEDFGTLKKTSSGYTYTSESGDTWAFDATGRLRSITDLNNRATTFGYNPQTGQLATVGAVDGNTVTIGPDPNAQRATVQFRESGGRTVTINFAGQNVASIVDADPTGTLSTRSFNYDADRELTDETWGTQQAHYQYGCAELKNAGLVTGFDLGTLDLGSAYTVDAAAAWGLGGIDTTQSPVKGPFTGVVNDPRKNATQYIVDPLGRTGKTTFADWSFTTEVRNRAGDVVQFTDERNYTTTYRYDTAGDMIGVSRPDGSREAYEYNDFGEVTKSTDSYGESTTNKYDAQGNLIKVTDPLKNVTEYHHYAGGLLQWEQDARGDTTTYLYDDASRLSYSFDAYNQPTQYTYDAAGNFKTVTDPVNRVTATTYDGLNRLVAKTDVNGGQWSWTYNDVGQVRTETDPEQLPTEYQYDSRGLLVAQIDAKGSGTLQRIYKYEYDAAENRAVEWQPLQYDQGGAQNWWDRTVTAYDSRNRVSSVTEGTDYTLGEFAFFGQARTTSYRYDKAGNLLWKEYSQQYDSVNAGLAYPVLIHDSYDYDPLGRVTRETVGEQGFWSNTVWVVDTGKQGRTTWTWYDLNGNVQLVEAPDGTLTGYHYDELNRQDLTVEALGTPLRRTTKTGYDEVGNVAWTTDGLGYKTQYGYDKLDRLISTTEAVGTDKQRTTLTTYDAVGRVLWQYDPLVYGATQYMAPSADYSGPLTHVGTENIYDDTNHTVTTIRAANVAPGTAPADRTTFSHVDPKTVTSYDSAGRVSAVTEYLDTQTSRTTVYGYDGLGRRTGEYENARIVLSGGLPTLQYDRSSTWTYNAADQVTFETRSGTSTAPGAPTFQSVTDAYSYDLFGRLAMVVKAASFSTETEPSNYQFDPGTQPITLYRYDAQDNLVLVTDPNGNLTQNTYTRFNEVETTSEGGTYDANHNPSNFLRVTKNWYDNVSQVIWVTQNRFLPGQDDPSTYVDTLLTKYTYDALGRKTSVTEGGLAPQGTGTFTTLARTTSYAYDADDRLTSVTEPLLIPSGLRGWPGSVLPVIPRTTVYGYDALGRQTSVTTAAGAVGSSLTSTREYDASDNLVWEATPRQYDNVPTPPKVFGISLPTLIPSSMATVTVYTYDALNRKTSETDAANASAQELGHAPPVTTWTYDAFDRVRVVEKAGGPTSAYREATRYTYDLLDQVTLIEDGLTPTKVDNAAPNLVLQFVPLRSETLAYDGAGNLVNQVTGLSAKNGFTALYAGGMISHPVTTQFAYDALGRLRIQTEVQQYATAGQSEVDRITETSYDANGNVTLVSVHDNDTSSTPATPTAARLAQDRMTKYVYDRLDQKIAMIEAYNPYAELSSANQQNLSGLLPTVATYQQYDTQYDSPTTKYQYDASGHVIGVTNPRGVTSKYSYDVLGRLQYSNEGVVMPVTTAGSMATSIAGQYYVAGQTLYRYDAADRLTGVGVMVKNVLGQDPKWIWTKYGYDAQDQQTSITEGVVTTGDDAKQSADSPFARQTLIVYDAAGNKREVTTGIADASQKVGTQLYAQVQRTVYDYDALGRVTLQWAARPTDVVTGSFIAAAGLLTDPTRPFTRYKYDALGNAIQTTTNISSPGNVAVRVDTFEYDALNRLTVVRQAANVPAQARTTRTWYDAADNKIRVIDANGVRTEDDYDGFNQVVTEQVRSNLGQPGGASQNPWTTTTDTRDIWGEVTRVQNDMTQVDYTYDRLGRQASKSTRTGLTTNERGQPINSQEVVQYGYDPAGNQVLVQDKVQPLIPGPFGTLPVGWRIENTWTVYDPLNRVVATYDPANRSTIQKYDSLGRMIEKWDRDNKFDTLTNLDGSMPPQPQTSEGGGQLTNYNRRVTRYEYDDLGRETAERWYTSAGVPSLTTDSYYGANNFAYDSADHAILTWRTNGTGGKFFVTQRAYDDYGRLKEEDEPIRLTSQVNMYLKFGYDAVGHVVSITDNYGSGATQVSQYDTAGRLTWRGTILTSTDPSDPYFNPYLQGISFSFDYKPQASPSDGLRDLVANVYGYNAGTIRAATTKIWRVENGYYDNGELNVRHNYDYPNSNQKSVERVSYQYDSTGLLKVDHRINDVVGGFARATTYKYDTEGQVSSLTRSDKKGETTSVLDASGNAPYRSSGDAQSAATTGNRISKSVLTDRNSNTYANYYDGEGNLVFQGQLFLAGPSLSKVRPAALGYTYDHDNHLVQVSSGVWGGLPNLSGDPPPSYATPNLKPLVDYQYDAEGRLVKRIQHTDKGDQITLYVSVGQQLYAELNVAADASGYLLSMGQGAIRYIYGPTGDQLLGRTGDNTSGAYSATYFYATDRQGSVLSIYSPSSSPSPNASSGALDAVKVLSYSSTQIDNTGVQAGAERQGFADSMAYTGRPYDAVTHLQYNNARWYDPGMGRFISQDPIGLAGGDTNLYRYVFNSYPNATDPSGRVLVVGAVAGGVIGGVAGGLMEWVNNPRASFNDIAYAAGRGALVGAVAGATAGASLVMAAGGGALAMGAAGVASAAAGDLFGQAAGWSLDQVAGRGPTAGKSWDASYKWQQTAGAAVGGLFGVGFGAATNAMFRSGAQLGAQQLGSYGVWAAGGFVGGYTGDVATQLFQGKSLNDFNRGQALLCGLFGVAGGVAARWGGGRVANNYHNEGWTGQVTRFLAPDAPLFMKVCFAAETPMRTPVGSVRADAVVAGMRLLSRDEHDPEGSVAAKVVEEVFVREGLITNLRLPNGVVVRSTFEHPFFVKGKNWTALGQIKAGEEVWTEASGWVTVEAVEETGQWETVYNFRISDFHTYFVGCDEWGFSVWAHNAACAVVEEAGELRLVNRETGEIYHRSNSVRELAEFASKNDHTITAVPARLLDPYGQVREGWWTPSGSDWTKPENWRGPSVRRKQGNWEGPEGNSTWISKRKEVIEIVGINPETGQANPIVFNRGAAELGPWSQGEVTVPGLRGRMGRAGESSSGGSPDTPLIYGAVWEQKMGQTTPYTRGNRDQVLNWLASQSDGYGGTGLRPHHAGGETVQLIPARLHDKLGHTDISVR